MCDVGMILYGEIRCLSKGNCILFILIFPKPYFLFQRMGVRIYFMDFDTQGSGICQSPKDDILTIKGDLAVFENLP